MALPATHVVVTEAATSTPTIPLPTFDERWAAWQKKAIAHDRAVRRKIALVTPLVVVAIAAIAYVLAAR